MINEPQLKDYRGINKFIEDHDDLFYIESPPDSDLFKVSFTYNGSRHFLWKLKKNSSIYQTKYELVQDNVIYNKGGL